MIVKSPVRYFLTMLLACACIGVLAPSTHAYKCKPLKSPLEELKEADAVFVGRVTRVKEEKSEWITYFEVDRYWKGPARRTIIVHSGKHLYGYRFATGKKYLVYAFGKDELETGRCNRTKGLEEAAADVKEIGEGKAPE
jgi:hypothetical protein